MRNDSSCGPEVVMTVKNYGDRRIVDWEERRYEIAKHVLPECIEWFKPDDNDICGIDYVKSVAQAVCLADQLVKELQKQ